MAEFLHQVIKKREREMEMRGLLDFDSPIFQRARESYREAGTPQQHPFRDPAIVMPPANEIAYRFNPPNNGVTEHSVIFPNVSGWIQSAVLINTPPSVTVRSPQLLALIGWDLLAGHPCRPNYSWSDNTYTCRTCSGTYTTDGNEWQHG
jgi:hypothetical protein